jgi:hypothetical protein
MFWKQPNVIDCNMKSVVYIDSSSLQLQKLFENYLKTLRDNYYNNNSVSCMRAKKKLRPDLSLQILQYYWVYWRVLHGDFFPGCGADDGCNSSVILQAICRCYIRCGERSAAGSSKRKRRQEKQRWEDAQKQAPSGTVFCYDRVGSATDALEGGWRQQQGPNPTSTGE